MKRYVALALCTCLVPSSVLAQVGRHGGGQRVNVQNRSSNVNRNYNNNTNINRNVNVNQNVNVNRNVALSRNPNDALIGGGFLEGDFSVRSAG